MWLLGVLLGDPGEIRRSQAACLPLPPAAERALARGERLEANVLGDGEREGFSFCARSHLLRGEGQRSLL